MNMNKLSVLLVKDGRDWTAQCLEYDIAAQGKTMRLAMAEFQNMIVAESAYSAIKGKPVFDGIPAAPQYYWKLYGEAAEPLANPRTVPFRLEMEGVEVPPAFALSEPVEYRAA